MANIVVETRSTDFVEFLVRLEAEAAGDDLFLDLGGAAEDRLDTVEMPELTNRVRVADRYSRRSRWAPSGQCEPQRSRGAIWAGDYPA
jgi:hypothetical protein